MLSLLLSLISSISYDGENIFYVSDTNFSDVINKFPASILLVQQGTDNERFRYMSDFINAAPLLMTRCFFVIMNGDRSKNFVEKVHLVHTKGYYFFRYGNLIEEYTGDTNSDAITKYALEKTGLAFTAFQDYPLAQDFIESHKISIVFYLNKASGPLFDQFKEIAETYRDIYAFGFSPDPDVTYELRVRYFPSIVLYRNTDKAKILYPFNITEQNQLNETELMDWVHENEQPNFEEFNINHQEIYYKSNSTVGLFFVPVEQEDKEKAMYQINQITKKYKQQLNFAVIDAATGNRFMQSLGFGRYADPAFSILKYTPKRMYKYLYGEGSTFRMCEISLFIEDYFMGKVNYSIKSSDLPKNNSLLIIKEINSFTMKEMIQESPNFTIILFYEDWDRLYLEFLPIYEEIANEIDRSDVIFCKMDAGKNDILYGHNIKQTPCIKIFPNKPQYKIYTYSKKLDKTNVEKWILKSINKTIKQMKKENILSQQMLEDL